MLSVCLLAPLLPDARAQSENPPANIPAFSLFIAPDVADRSPDAPHSGPVVPPEAPVLLAEGTDSPGDGGSQPRSSLALGLRLDSKAPLSPLDWVLMEVVLTERSAGLVSAVTLGTPPMAQAAYVLGRDGSSSAPRIDYTDVDFVLTRDHPDADPASGELRLYTVLFHGDGIALETVERSDRRAELDTVSARAIPEQCRERSASAQVPLLRGDGISIGTSTGFEQSDNSVIFDSYGPLLSSVNNSDDFHGDQVFAITARIACGSAFFAGAALAQLVQPRPEHSLVVRMRDDDVPRLWFDPAISRSQQVVAINEDGTPAPGNRLPGLINAANATRYALVSADDDRRLQPNYSAEPLNLRVGMTERNALYGEDFVFLDADGNPIPEADLVGGTHDVDVQVPPGRAAFSAPLEIVDDDVYELSDDLFWGFRSNSDGSQASPFPYIPAPANSEGYRVLTSRGSDDLFAEPTTVGLMTVADNDILRIAHEAVPPILFPAEGSNRITSIYGYSFRGARLGANLARVDLTLSFTPTDGGDTPLSSCRSSSDSYLCEYSGGSLGNPLGSINLNREQGTPPGEFIRVGGISSRNDVTLGGASVMITLGPTSAQRIELSPPLVLYPLRETPLVTVIALPEGSPPPAAGATLGNNLRSFAVDEPNPAEHCPAPAFYGDGFSMADCINPPVRLELYAVLLQVDALSIATTTATLSITTATRTATATTTATTIMPSFGPTAVVGSNSFADAEGSLDAAVPYDLPEDDDYTWTPAANIDHWFVIAPGESSVRLGTLEIEADQVIEGTLEYRGTFERRLIEHEERIELPVARRRIAGADMPARTRLAVDYLDLPESLQTIGDFAEAGITVRDADRYMYTPLVYPVISTIREDDPEDLPGSLSATQAHRFTVRVMPGEEVFKTVIAYDLQARGYRGMPFGIFGGDTWQNNDQHGASRSIAWNGLPRPDEHRELRLADAARHRPERRVRLFAPRFALPNICDITARVEDFTVCTTVRGRALTTWLHGQYLLFPLPAADTAQAAFTMYYQRQFVREFLATLPAQVSTHGTTLAERITPDGSLALRMHYVSPALTDPSVEPDALLYQPGPADESRVTPTDQFINPGVTHTALDYIGKTPLEFHYREGGALGRAMGEPIDVGGGVIRQSQTTVLLDEIPGALAAGPESPATPLSAVSGSTLRYTFRAPPGLTLRLSVFATGPASESVLGPADGGALGAVVLPVALYADADPERALMRAELVPHHSTATVERGRRGHNTLYLGFMEQGNTPAHLDFLTLQCNSDPVRFTPAIDDPMLDPRDQMGYYASVPHSGGANALADYTLELGMPPLARASLEDVHEPFLSIASAIHCVRSELSQYHNLHSLKCSDTREAITGTPAGVCAATTQTVTLDIPRSLSVNTLGFSGHTLAEGRSPADAVAIELLTAQALPESFPDTEVLEWTLQFDQPEPRLRYDGQPLPASGRLAVAFASTSSETRYGGARFLRSRAMLTLESDQQFQPPRILGMRALDAPGEGHSRSASLLLSDESGNVFGVAPAAGNAEPTVALRGPVPAFLRLRLAQVPFADTEVRGAFATTHAIGAPPFDRSGPLVDISPAGAGSVLAEMETGAFGIRNTYTFSVVFPAGRQSIAALRVEPSGGLPFTATGTMTVALESVPGFPLAVVDDADEGALGLVNGFTLAFFPLADDSIELPAGIALVSQPAQRADEGATLGYDIATAVGASVRLRPDLRALPEGLRNDYQGRALVWSVAGVPGGARLERRIDFSGPSANDLYITFHHPSVSAGMARASCPGIDPRNELLVPHAANSAVANYRISVALPEDNDDYWGRADAALAEWTLRHEIACVSSTVGDHTRASPIGLPCEADTVRGSPGSCVLRHSSGESTVTVTVDDNDARIGRIELSSNAPEDSPLRKAPLAVSEPLPPASRPTLGELVPADGTTLGVTLHLPGTNRSAAPAMLTLGLSPEDAYARRVLADTRPVGDGIDVGPFAVPAGGQHTEAAVVLGIPEDDAYHHPGRLRLADVSADALAPPESTVVRVLDLGDGYYEFPRELVDSALLSPTGVLPVRVRLLAPAALETTLRISFDTTIHMPPGTGRAEPGDFVVMAGADTVADTLVRTRLASDRVRDEITLRFGAGAREADALRVAFGPSFYTGLVGMTTGRVTIEMPGAISELLSGRVVMITDEDTGTARPLHTAFSVDSVAGGGSVVVRASTQSFVEGDDADALFFLSTLGGDGRPIRFSFPWTLELELADPLGVLLGGRVRVAPPSVSTATRPGGAPGRTVLTLGVPANSSSPITVGARFVAADGILQGTRPVSLGLLTVTDAAGFLSLPTGRGSTATVYVVDSGLPVIDLSFTPGTYDNLLEGEQTTFSITVRDSDATSTNYVADSANVAPIVVAVFSVYYDPAEHRLDYGGSCERPVVYSDYCIRLGPGAGLSPGVRWVFMTFGDDAQGWPALTMDPGATLRAGTYGDMIVLRALDDVVLDGDETGHAFVANEPQFIGANPASVPEGVSRGTSRTFLVSGIPPSRPLALALPGKLFYSVRPLTLRESNTASASWEVALVNAAGLVYQYNIPDHPMTGEGRSIGLGLITEPLSRGFSDSERSALIDAHRPGVVSIGDDISMQVPAAFEMTVPPPGDDADLINEIAFFALHEYMDATSRTNAIAPHPTLGVDDGLPALRLHFEDDDRASDLTPGGSAEDAMALIRYEPNSRGIIGPVDIQFLLDGTQIQGAAAFVSSSTAAPGPLVDARRRSSFGVLFAFGRSPALPFPFGSASPLLRERKGGYHYVVLALALRNTRSTPFDYRTVDPGGTPGSNNPGFAQELMDLRIGQWANGRISDASRRYSNTEGDAQLLLVTNDPDFLRDSPADADPVRAELRRICPVLAEAGLTSTTVGSLAVADGSRYNDAAFHLLDLRRDGAYYGFRENAAYAEVELLCASDPFLSPDLDDNSRPDGSRGLELCADSPMRMVGTRCLYNMPTNFQLDYQNYLPGFHDSMVPVQLGRAHGDVLLEPDDARGVAAQDAQSRVALTVQGSELQLHADYGGDSVAFVPRANRPGAGTVALQLELAWDDTGGAHALAIQELELSAPARDPASTTGTLLLSLDPLPSGDALMLDVTIAARPDDRYEHCLNHRLFADRDADLGYLDTGSSTDLHVRTRRALCSHVDDPALDDDVRTELEKRGRLPGFRLLPRLYYRALGEDRADLRQEPDFEDNVFRVRDSDSYAHLVVSNTVLDETDTDSAITVQVQFGGNADTPRYGNDADATSLLPMDLALVISSQAPGLGIRYSGGGLASPVVVPSPTAVVDIEITLGDPGTRARSFDPMALRGMWFEAGSLLGESDVRELLLFDEAAGTSTATRYDLAADNSADPVLGKIVSIVRLRGMLPAAEPLEVMRIAVRDDEIAEGVERFAVHLGILSASQSSETDSASNRRMHSQRASRAGALEHVAVDTSQGIGRSYAAAFDALRAAGRPVQTDTTIEIGDDEMPDIIVRDNAGTVIVRENNLPVTMDPEGDDYREELSSISAPNITAPDPNDQRGSGALLRVDLSSPAGDHRLPLMQEYQVLYYYIVPTTHTVVHAVDLRAGAPVYLLLGNPALVEAGGACADRVAGLGTPGKPLIKAGEHPSPGGVPLDIRDQLPDGGLGARLFFSARDTSNNHEWFQGEGLFNYAVTLLCSDSTLFDPDNPVTDAGAKFCVSGGAAPNVVANDPVDGGAACTAHRSRDYAVRDTNYALAVTVNALPGEPPLNNFQGDLVASYDEPDAARSAIGRAAIPVVNRSVTLELYNRVTRQISQINLFSNIEGRTRYVLPDLDALFAAPFAGRPGGAPFVVTPNPDGLPSFLPDEEITRWFSFSTRENNHLDGVDRMVELTLPLDMLPAMPGRVVHLVIESGLSEDAPGYTPFVLGSGFSATLRLSDSDNYYYHATRLRTPERDGDSASEPVVIIFGARSLGQDILDADPLAGDRIGMRIERIVGDVSNIPREYQPATLDDLRLHNLDALPGPGTSDPGRVLAPGSIAETEIIAGQDGVRLVTTSSSSPGFLDGTAVVPFYLAGSLRQLSAESSSMHLFDIGATRDGEPEMDEALDLIMDLRFLGRPAPNADFGLHAEPNADLNAGRGSIGTALPVTVPFETQTPYAALWLSTGTRTTTRYLLDENDVSTPTAPTLAVWSFTELSLPDAPLLLTVDMVRSERRRNVFFDDARVALARGDDGVPESSASVNMRHCADGEGDCQSRRYRVYLQLGPYTGDDDVVLRAVTSDAADPHSARRASCAAGLSDPVDRAAPYLVANVLRNPAPAPGVPAYNDSDPRYELADDGRQLRLVLSDDGVSSGRAPRLEGTTETLFYDDVGIAALRFGVLCSDDPDYGDSRAEAVCNFEGNQCAARKDAVLVLRGPSFVFRFAPARNDANPLFITDPVLGLREPDTLAAAPLTERFGMRDFPARNLPSVGTELHLYFTLASGPTPGSGLRNPLAVHGTARAVSGTLLDPSANPGGYTLCLPHGETEVQNADGSDPGDAVVGDCALAPASTVGPLPTLVVEQGSNPPVAYAGRVRVLDDNRWEPVAAEPGAAVAFPGQHGYRAPGSELSPLVAPAGAPWLAYPFGLSGEIARESLATPERGEPLLSTPSVRVPRPPVVAYPDRLSIRDAEATLWLGFEDAAPVVDGVAYLDHNALTPAPDRVRMRLYIGSAVSTPTLPLGLSAGSAGGVVLRLPAIVPGCETLRRSTAGDYMQALALDLRNRAPDGTESSPVDFLPPGLASAFMLGYTAQDMSHAPCATPYPGDDTLRALLPATGFDGALHNPLLFELEIAVPMDANANAVAEYSIALAERTQAAYRFENGRFVEDIDAIPADALYRLYDAPEGGAHPRYPRTLRMRVGDAAAPVVCAGAVEGTERSVAEVLGTARDCLVVASLGPYIVQSSWTLAVDYRPVLQDAATTLARDAFYELDRGLPTPLVPEGDPTVAVEPVSTRSPYALHYYALESTRTGCAVIAPVPRGGPGETLPPAYTGRVPIPVAADGSAPLTATLDASSLHSLRPGRTHCALLSASDGVYASYSEAVQFTPPPYRPALDANDNGIPDDAEFASYNLPERTDPVVAGAHYAEAYCNDIMGDYDPALGARNDCDEDGVPDVAELALGVPGAVSPVDEGRVQRVLCFAAETRTRLPLPEGVRLHCTDDGSALLGSPAMSAEWRIVLGDTRYRGMGYTLGAAMADDAPGPNAGGLLPASYWLTDPDFDGLVQLLLLPNVELDAPARVPVFTRFEYVDGGNVLHPELLGDAPENRVFTHRGESYRGPGSSATLYYAITDDSLDPDRARSLPQAVGLRLFGSTAAVDELSYRAELQSSTATTVLGPWTALRSGAIGANRALVADLPLVTSSGLTFGPGVQRLGVVLRARIDTSTGALTLERLLGARVRGMLQPDDDLRVRLTSAGAHRAHPRNQFPFGFPPRYELRLSERFYENANTPRGAPLAHFSAPGDSTDSATVFRLSTFGVHSRQFEDTGLNFEVLNYATGRVAGLGTRFAYVRVPGDETSPGLGEIYRPQDITVAELCTALGGCNFDADPFYLFELSGTIRLVGPAYWAEEETELPPGDYQHTHNRDGTGTVIEGISFSSATARPRVSVERRQGAGNDRLLLRITQIVQFGGPEPGIAAAGNYTDADYDGVPDSSVRPAVATRLDFAVGRNNRPDASLYGSIQTPLRFARVHLGGYGRAGYLRETADFPPLVGANIGGFADVDGDYPEYPAQGGYPLSDFALDFSISCDPRRVRGEESRFDGTPVPGGSTASLSVDPNCLGELTPILLHFPAGAIIRGVLPAQVLTLSGREPRTGFNEAPTRLCGFIPGDVLISQETLDARAANGCPAVSVSDGRSADSGDSFAFAELDAAGVCPNVRDDSQWPRINQPALGGERCLRLLVSDNGPNDAAPFDRVINDPLVWSGNADFGVPPARGGPTRGIVSGGSGGGGIVGLWSLLALLVLAALHGCRARRVLTRQPATRGY